MILISSVHVLLVCHHPLECGWPTTTLKKIAFPSTRNHLFSVIPHLRVNFMKFFPLKCYSKIKKNCETVQITDTAFDCPQEFDGLLFSQWKIKLVRARSFLPDNALS